MEPANACKHALCRGVVTNMPLLAIVEKSVVALRVHERVHCSSTLVCGMWIRFGRSRLVPSPELKRRRWSSQHEKENFGSLGRSGGARLRIISICGGHGCQGPSGTAAC